jgi:hypothetical protein
MLGELGTFIRPLLALLLIVLTPIGTGEGVHRDQLLDPLFPHVHIHSAPDAAAGASETAHAGVAIGGGTGAAADSIAPGLTPPVPSWLMLLPRIDAPWQYPMLTDLITGRPNEPPPDPPPDLD